MEDCFQKSELLDKKSQFGGKKVRFPDIKIDFIIRNCYFI